MLICGTKKSKDTLPQKKVVKPFDFEKNAVKRTRASKSSSKRDGETSLPMASPLTKFKPILANTKRRDYNFTSSNNDSRCFEQARFISTLRKRIEALADGQELKPQPLPLKHFKNEAQRLKFMFEYKDDYFQLVTQHLELYEEMMVDYRKNMNDLKAKFEALLRNTYASYSKELLRNMGESLKGYSNIQDSIIASHKDKSNEY